jgi:hypothetical protein
MKNNRILAIAINDYDNAELNKIQNCEKDVTELIQVLTTRYSFEDVDFIHEKKDTTRKALYNKLQEYFINRFDDENVLLIYAGHGQYNPKLETAYWQPSDCDPTDSSSWLSITDIMTFVKASKAFHISIISDSCFSGAMFETSRGGGINAFETKKSRLALTSGSIETVSDGKKDQLSPFAKSLISELNENKNDELPFSILGNNILMQFNENKSQTPMFGPLNDVGHQGGSFVFKLKKEKEQIEYTNKFLKKRMSNLFIQVSDKHLEIIEDLKPIHEEKVSVVKNQQYEKAAELRDKEKELEYKIYNTCPDYLDSFYLPMGFDNKTVKKASELDASIEKFNKAKKKEPLSIEKEIERITKELLEKGDEVTEERKEWIMEMAEFIATLQTPKNPTLELLRNCKDIFVTSYKINVMNIYKSILEIKATSKSEYLENKTKSLKDIIIKIYKFEVQLLIRGTSNDFDELISMKELDMEIINWIRNK